MMEFRDLPIGSIFQFDHSELESCSDIAHGPWQKTGARSYVLSGPGAGRRGGHGGCRHKVGRVSITVLLGEDCRKR